MVTTTTFQGGVNWLIYWKNNNNRTAQDCMTMNVVEFFPN